MIKLYSTCWVEAKKLNLTDIAFLSMVTSIMALYDFSAIAVILQMIFLLSVAMEMFLQKVSLFSSKIRTQYILYYTAFILWAALTYLWAEYKSTFVQMLVSITQVSAIGIGTAYYINSQRRVRFALFALVFAALVFITRFVVDVPPEIWGHQGRIGVNLSYGSNKGPLMLSYVILVLAFLAIIKKRWLLYIPISMLMFIAMLFGTRQVLVFLFVGTFTLLAARALTKRQFILSTISLAILTGVLFLLIMNVNLLYNSIGRRFADVREVLAEQVSIDDTDGKIALPTKSDETSGEDSKPITGLHYVAEALPTAKPIKKSISSASHRLEMIQMAIKVFLTAPIQGIGLDGFRFVNTLRITYSHSNQFELLSTLGMIGFVMYYWFHAFILVYAWRKRRENYLYMIVVSFLIALFVTDVFSMTYTSEPIHVYIGILVGIMSLNQKLAISDNSLQTLSIEC